MEKLLDFLGFKKHFLVDDITVRTNFIPKFERENKYIEEAKRIIKMVAPVIRRYFSANGGTSFTRFNGGYHLTFRLSDVPLNGDKIPKDIYQEIFDEFNYYFDLNKDNVYFELNSSGEYIIITIVL